MLIKDMDADGIEANYIYIDQNNNKINDCDKWREFINGHHLIATIGSDFHEDDGIHPKVGLINEELNIDDAMVDKIISNLIG